MKKTLLNSMYAAMLVAGLGLTSCAGNKTETETEATGTTIDTVSTGETGADTDMNMAPTDADADSLNNTGDKPVTNPVGP